MCVLVWESFNINLYFAYRNLLPVTQLYVSIDASTKESLKKIDRPLFRDFWPRFLSSLDALSEKVTICYEFYCKLIALIVICRGRGQCID